MNILRIDNGCWPNHTVVTVQIPGRYFPTFACSCGAMSEDFPSFRPENKCAVCGEHAVMLDVAEIDSDLCGTCFVDFCAWLEMNPHALPMDFLREKISNGS